MWNLLDYPGAVFPTGLAADPHVDVIDPNFASMGPEDSYNFAQCTFLHLRIDSVPSLTEF